MEFQDLMFRFAVALGIGLLIGIERGWRTRGEVAGSRTAGIRTFAISGLLGGVIGALGQALGAASAVGGGVLIGLGFAAYAAVIALFCREENRADGTFSATTAVAAMLTFALGIHAMVGDLRVSSALAVAAAFVLAMREPLHGWVERITWAELRSGLVLLAMTVIALPVLPDTAIGPLGGVNLRQVWLIAISLAAASFIGYAAAKYFGQSRGLLVAGLAGGLVSSTAVTITNARRAAGGEGSSRLLAAGVAMASMVMFVRVGVLVAALNTELLAMIAPALAGAAVAAVGYAAIAVSLRQRAATEAQPVEFRNPFDFRSVIGFAVFLGVIIVGGRAVGETFGTAGAIVSAVIVGLVDVDAITVSVARLTPYPLHLQGAAAAILAAVASDTVSKVFIGAALGRRRFAVEVAIMALGCFVFGAAVMLGTRAWLAR